MTYQTGKSTNSIIALVTLIALTFVALMAFTTERAEAQQWRSGSGGYWDSYERDRFYDDWDDRYYERDRRRFRRDRNRGRFERPRRRERLWNDEAYSGDWNAPRTERRQRNRPNRVRRNGGNANAAQPRRNRANRQANRNRPARTNNRARTRPQRAARPRANVRAARPAPRVTRPKRQANTIRNGQVFQGGEKFCSDGTRDCNGFKNER